MESIQTSSASVRNEFHKFNQSKVISEYIWNAFDANANEVHLRYITDGLDTVQSITITDDGDGIDPNTHELTFGKFKDSPKRALLSPTIKGQKGLGRFSFHKLAKAVIWDSVTSSNSCSIKIESDSLNNYDVDHKRECFSPVRTGTRAELLGVSESNISGKFLNTQVIPILIQEFSWLLASSSRKSIFINGEPINLLGHQKKSIKFNVNSISFDVLLISWNEKPKENSYVYFVNSEDKIKNKINSGLNKKNGFYPSAYIKSEFFGGFDFLETDLINDKSAEHNKIYDEVKHRVLCLLKDLHDEFREIAADKLIDLYEKEGIFPDHSKDSIPMRKWKYESLKNTIRVLYSAEPSIFGSHLNKTQKRIIVKLLDKVTVSPSDDLFDVLNGVVSLNNEEQSKLADILKDTSLGNITNAISEVRARKKVIDIVNDLNEEYTKATKEVGEIQSVVESNLWLFGEQYHLLTAEEPDFEQALRELLSIHGNEEYYQKGSIKHPDKNKEMDIFAIRRNFDVDEKGNEFYRCLVVELKRPSDTLKDKHLDQIQKYFKVISSNHIFNDGLHKWDFVLAGRKITNDPLARTMIDAQLENSKSHGEPGLVMKTDRFKISIKPWSQVFSEHNIRHKHLLKHLESNKTKVVSGKDSLIEQAISIGKTI
ncbi:Histidine kinase-, DNA gyrase B-, and HSP90-like ATPase [Marinomonas polaris DSM 16579]|uniref:Histidine kinase-, DNA gyrase B-, and HSP90-like ATPase n=1 Tax=Marinomonas polaris DSM 16579 TaxID=1122206 RepID=A0A1M4T4N1_9GAMM|nr:ATP-binding protein [Marinomonas polaris]SHE39463.1 Histidine kinase-, DNA gyrase B-, and HSP90-like ATPase [Marinomonas polaris DSM 16579]